MLNISLIAASSSTRYAPKKSAFYQHVAAVKKGQAPLSHEKKTGASAKLTAEQQDVVCGAVLQATSNIV